MKKILILAIAMITVTGVYAQQDFKNRVSDVTGTEFNFGLKYGLNFTGINNDLNKSKLSFHAGGFAEFRFNDILGFQAEMLYSRQGDRGKEGKNKIRHRVNYLNFPLLAKLYLIDDFSMELGPQIGFLLNGKSIAKTGSTEIKSKLRDLNSVDCSFVIGFSYQLPPGLIFSARYNLGLTNVFDKDVVRDNSQNRVFQLSAGWRF